MIVQLWIAEGPVEPSTSSESWEKVGEEYISVKVVDTMTIDLLVIMRKQTLKCITSSMI
jgi:hypothetical protein